MTHDNETKVTTKSSEPSTGMRWLVALTLFFIQPLGAVLWFMFFKRPHVAIKILVVLPWFFIWFMCVAAIVMAANGYKFDAATTSSNKPQVVASKQVARIGQVVSESGFNFTVNSIKCGETRISTGGAVYFYTDAQGQFCRLNVTITNTSSSANSIDASAQFIYNDKGQRYTYDSSATSHAANYSIGNPLDDDINPGNSITGDFIFDVPADATLATAELHAHSGSGGVKVSLQ